MLETVLEDLELDSLPWFEGMCSSCIDTNAWVTPTAYDGNVCQGCFETFYSIVTGERLNEAYH